MDVSPYLKPAEYTPQEVPVAIGRLVGSYRVRPGQAGRCRPAGWPSYLEFEIANSTPGAASRRPQEDLSARALCVPGGASGPLMEVWWAASKDDWSETRSVRWRPDPARPAQGWAVPLDRLPHWNPVEARLIRFMFRTAGPTTVGEPRFLR